MRLETIIDRAKATGLPLAKDAFRETKENPLPVPPYLVYIVPQVVGRGSDERILLHKLMQTKEGREYLDNCWRMEQTKPDRKKLREKMRKGER